MLNNNWFKVHLPGQDIKEIQSLGKCKTLLAENMRDWTRSWKEDGLKAGRKEGIKQGLIEGLEQGIEQGFNQGEIEVLKRLLIIKFGDLPDWVIEKLNNCTSEHLAILSERIFDANTLDAFFE